MPRQTVHLLGVEPANNIFQSSPVICLSSHGWASLDYTQAQWGLGMELDLSAGALQKQSSGRQRGLGWAGDGQLGGSVGRLSQGPEGGTYPGPFPCSIFIQVKPAWNRITEKLEEVSLEQAKRNQLKESAAAGLTMKSAWLSVQCDQSDCLFLPLQGSRTGRLISLNRVSPNHYWKVWYGPGGLVQNADSQTPLQTYWIIISSGGGQAYTLQHDWFHRISMEVLLQWKQNML